MAANAVGYSGLVGEVQVGDARSGRLPAQGMVIGGEWVSAESEETMETLDPTTGDVLTSVPAGGEADVERAVQAALVAQKAWAQIPWQQRSARLHDLAKAVEDHKQRISLLDALDAGLPVTGGMRDIDNGISSLGYYGNLASELKGTSLATSGGLTTFTTREPFGVVGRMIPFNHPFQSACSSLAVSVAAGNAIILKPSDYTPLSALYLAELALEILPPGLVNVVTGRGDAAGAAIVRHPEIRRIAFTGGIVTARSVMRDAAAHVKSLSLELGGKNPLIVYPDVSVEEAARACVQAMNFARVQGQSCGSPSRVFVHSSICEQFVEELAVQMREIVVGDPVDESTMMGPLAYKAHFDRVCGHVARACDEKAVLVTGGKRPQGLDRGYFLEPTLFSEVQPEMSIAREEVFGPVVAVLRWTDEEDMLSVVNSLPYGLTANIWTNDLSAALGVAHRVEAGYVTVNGHGERPAGAPFGGYKDSGVGRESCLEDLLSYSQLKTINLRWAAK